MKLITFEFEGTLRTGALRDEQIIDLGPAEPGSSDLLTLLTTLGVEGIAAKATGLEPSIALADVQLHAPVPNPQKIICVGVNYRAHRDEASQPERSYPTLFTRFADTQTGPTDDVVRPGLTDRFDYEGELAIVIGAPAWRVPAEKAFDFIAGYSVYNDFTVRDWQRHTTQWFPGKNFPGTGAFGPALVTVDEVADVSELALTTRVNGDVRQSATLADLVFDIPALVEYITTFTPLGPGDVIVTGTPGGVGLFMDPPTFLAPGDVVEVEIPGVGLLRNAVVAERGEATASAS